MGGGEFTCRKTMQPEVLDIYWENLVLGLIGETIDEADDVCGCRVVDKSKKGTNRTMFRLELWVRSGCCGQDVADKLRARMADALSDGEASSPIAKFAYLNLSSRSVHHEGVDWKENIGKDFCT